MLLDLPEPVFASFFFKTPDVVLVAVNNYICLFTSSFTVMQYGFSAGLKALACLRLAFFCTCGTLGTIQIC